MSTWKTIVEIKSFGIYTGAAGLVSIGLKESHCLHLLVKPSHWIFGFESTWYDGPWYSVGLGPFFLYTWQPS
jgi:hypothetical protein